MKSPEIFKALLLLLLLLAACYPSGNILAQALGGRILGTQAGDQLGTSIACPDIGAGVAGTELAVGAIQSTISLPGLVDLREGTTPQNIISSFNGNTPGALYGRSIDKIGDVNSDGLDDLVIGAPKEVSTQLSVLLSPNGANTLFGFSSIAGPTDEIGFQVAGLFDSLSGSGPNSFIASAPLYESSAACFSPNQNCGLIEVFDSISGSVIGRFEGSIDAGQLGSSLSSIGDLNADGRNDIVAGAPRANNDTGYVKIIFSILSGTILTTSLNVLGPSAGSLYGHSVTNVGDVDGGGIDDLLIGAPGFNGPNGVSSGQATLLRGETIQPGAPTVTTLCTINGAAANDQFGYSVRGIGDINGDSVLDFAISSPGALSNTGRVDIYSFSGGNCNSFSSLSGFATGENYGISLAGGAKNNSRCDFNNDNLPDLAIGGYADSNSIGQAATDAGSVTLFLANAPAPSPSPSPSASLAPSPVPSVLPSSPPSPQPSPNPTASHKVSLDYKLNKDGTLKGSIAISNGLLAKNCQAILWGRRSNSNLSSPGPIKALINNLTPAPILQLDAINLPKIRKDPLGKPYIYHMIAEVRCGNKKVFSKIRSRKLSCGIEDRVEVNEWEQLLDNRIVAR